MTKIPGEDDVALLHRIIVKLVQCFGQIPQFLEGTPEKTLVAILLARDEVASRERILELANRKLKELEQEGGKLTNDDFQSISSTIVITASIRTLSEWIQTQNLSNRTKKAILKVFPENEILTELIAKTESELLGMEGIGRKSLYELRESLAMHGLHFGMERSAIEHECRRLGWVRTN